MEHNLYDNNTDDYSDDYSGTLIMDLSDICDKSYDSEEEHQTDTACSWLVCHSRGDCSGEHCANCIHLPRLSGAPASQFFGEASRAFLQHGWRSAYSLRETLLDVSRESGAPAGQVEEAPGRASLEKLGCRTPPQLHAGGVGR